MNLHETLCGLVRQVKHPMMCLDNKKMTMEFVDLGLPSGSLWADRNIGADAPEQYGDYFRFGETKPFTRHSREYFFDYIRNDIAGSDRDASAVNLGKDCSMPTIGQVKELLKECQWVWIEQNGVKGMRVMGSNGNSVFLPAAGCRYFGSGTLCDFGSNGFYLSSSPTNSFVCQAMVFGSEYLGISCNYRALGFSIRAVR